MSRHEDREILFTLLYEYTFYEGADPEAFISSRKEMNETEYSEFVTESFIEAESAIKEIDREITEFSVGWKVKRMSKVTKSILRLAVYELLFTDTPPKAVINEAVELAKKFDEEKASGFVNGILNNLARAKGKLGDAEGSNE